MVLSQSQTVQLNKDIIEYLQNNGYTSTAKAFAEQAHLALQQIDAEGKKLQLKWRSIISLQTKINRLEDQVKGLEEQLANCGAGGARGADVRIEDLYIPNTPARHVLKGHRSHITALAFHPQYTEIASSSDDGTIKMWDIESGEYLRTLKGHTATVTCVNFDQNCKYLVSSSADLSVKLWQLNEYQCAKTFYGHNHSVSSACFVMEDEYVLSCSRDKTIKLWEVRTGFCKRTFIGHEEWVKQVIATTDSKTLASCSVDQNILLWSIDKEAPTMVLRGHDNVIESIIFAEDTQSQFLATSQMLKSKFKKQITLDSIKELTKNTSAHPSSTTTKHLFLFSGSRDKTIRLFNCSNGDQLTVFTGHDTWVRSLALHPTGKYLYSASDDKSLRVWDLNFGKEKKKVDAHDHFVAAVRYNGRYGVVATAGQDSLVKLWAMK